MIDHDYGASLGALNPEHMVDARKWRNDPRVFRWCRQTDIISETEQARWFEAQDKDPRIKMYSVWAKGKMVGVCGFTSIDMMARHAEFSLYIAPDFQRRGYAQSALKTLLKHGFLTLGLNQIWGECLDKNRALSIFITVGMKHDGKRRQFYFKDGALWDAHLVSISRDEWEKQPWMTPSES